MKKKYDAPRIILDEYLEAHCKNCCGLSPGRCGPVNSYSYAS